MDQQIRIAALQAAARLLAGVHPGPPATARELEETTVGLAARLAEWIESGR